MAYDHSTKIGNQGDVVKHAVHYNCIGDLQILIELFHRFDLLRRNGSDAQP